MSSDYGDFCREMREAKKKHIQEHGYSERSRYYMDLAEENRQAKFEARKEWKVPKFEAEKFAEKLIKKGAKLMTAGVYRLGRFDFYPRKSNARDYRTNQFYTQEEALKELKNEIQNS